MRRQSPADAAAAVVSCRTPRHRLVRVGEVAVSASTQTTAADRTARPERLARLATEFRREGLRGVGYPDDDGQRHKLARVRFEEFLRTLPVLRYEDRGAVRDVWKKAREGEFDYGRSGVTAGPNTAIRDVSEAGWAQMRDLIHALCYGGDDLITRFEAVTSIKGFGPVVTTKFLAITQPERFLPNFVIRSKKENPEWPGKLDMIELLARRGLLDASTTDEAQTLLEAPGGPRDVGDLAVRSNDMLLELLRPYFSQDEVVDTWGMAQFLYWLARPGQAL